MDSTTSFLISHLILAKQNMMLKSTVSLHDNMDSAQHDQLKATASMFNLSRSLASANSNRHDGAESSAPLSSSSSSIANDFTPHQSSMFAYNNSSDADFNTSRKKLFVGNLPSNTSLSEIIELFGKYGSVNQDLSVVKDDNYAFVHFHSERDAEIACREMHETFFKGRFIRVQYSTSQGHLKKSKSRHFFLK